ncbi:MAG: serine protease [Sphingobacteriales bacterium]|nr:MAG: serine protease [Sphingobacteriales bacterium]
MRYKKNICVIMILVLANLPATAQYLLEPSIRSSSILLKVKNGYGSGFLLTDTSSSSIFIVTALHVIADDSMSLRSDSIEIVAYRNDTDVDPQIRFRLSMHGAVKANSLQVDRKNDLAILRFAKFQMLDSFATLTYPDYIVKLTKNSLIQGWPSNETVGFNEIQTGSDIFIVGYPRSLGLRSNFDLDRPLYRKGIIAGKNYSSRRIIGDGAVYFGNSGGMVLAHFFTGKEFAIRLVGLISQYIPFEEYLFDSRGERRSLDLKNSGYSVIIPVDFISQLIRKF